MPALVRDRADRQIPANLFAGASRTPFSLRRASAARAFLAGGYAGRGLMPVAPSVAGKSLTSQHLAIVVIRCLACIAQGPPGCFRSTALVGGGETAQLQNDR